MVWSAHARSLREGGKQPKKKNHSTHQRTHQLTHRSRETFGSAGRLGPRAARKKKRGSVGVLSRPSAIVRAMPCAALQEVCR